MKPFYPKSLNFVLLQFIILSMAVGLLESCSWVTSRRSLFGDDPKNKRIQVLNPNQKSAGRFFRKTKPKTNDQILEEKLRKLEEMENRLSDK